MELPCEIWEKIILQVNDAKQCIKLFKSLPKLTQKNIREVFDNHIKSIQNKILYSVNNSMILAVENQNITIFEDNYAENQIKYVRYMKSESGENEYFVSVDKNGTIIFWDTKTYKFIDSIEIGDEIQNIEFHPSKTKLVVSLIKENLGLEIQSLTLTTHGIIFNETIIGYEPEFLIEIVYHPTLPYMFFIRYKNYKIYSIYLWKYEESDNINDFQYSAFERVELPFIVNFGIENMESFIYIYYLPFRVLDNGDFECLGKGVSYYYIIKMGIINNKFYHKEIERILYNSRFIIDYIRVKNKIIYLVDGYKIIEQYGANMRIIYQNKGEPISKLTLRKNYIIFLEDCVFKKISIDNFELVEAEEIIDCHRIPSDFFILLE
jgi:hypothetical protein